MHNWQVTSLGSIATFRTGKLDSNAAEDNGMYPFFTCSPETYRINTYAFDTEAVLLAGNNANAVYPIKYYKGKFNAYQRTYVIEPKSAESADCRYLYYLISFLLQKLKEASVGSATKFLTKQILENFQVDVPPLGEQKAIAKILSAFDDKIELNRRMNATLEEMARALFKAWFVDFEPVHANREGRPSTSASPEIAKLFPSDFENNIPKGWEANGLDEIATFLNGLALQKYPPESDEEFLPVIKIAQLRKGNTEGSDRASKNLKPEYIVNDGDVLFSWSGSLEVDLWCGGAGALNQHLFKVTSDKYPKWFYFLWTRLHLEDFRNIAAHKATTMGHIQRHHLREAKVCVPDTRLLEEMDAQFEPLIAKFISNAMESKTLSAIRDSLLPRLISGALRVSH